MVGLERVELRLFEKAELAGGDVISDFCAAAGIETDGLNWPPRVNESLSRRAIAFLRWCNRRLETLATPGSNTHARLSRLSRGIAGKLLNTGPQMEMTATDRDRILARCADSNERLRQWFFPERETLFDMRDTRRTTGADAAGGNRTRKMHSLHAGPGPGAERKSN